MKQYILLIQSNAKSESSGAEWEEFFRLAQESGVFRGGSIIGSRKLLGDVSSAKSTEHIAGYMRFDSDDEDKILDLVKKHPVLLHGGSVELCEMPKS